MPLNLVLVKDWKEVRGMLREQGHDFWASCLSHTTPMEMADRFQTMRVDGEVLAQEAFTHAYVAESGDVRADLNALIDEFGLGLRRKRARSGNEPGCVFVLASRGQPSGIKRRRTNLSATDKTLSTEERLRRTKMRFEVVSADQLGVQMSQSKADFWLTAYTGLDKEACKRKVVALQVEGAPAAERFARCLVAESRNCQEVTDRLCGLHGLGSRKTTVRSKPEPGCLALLLAGDGKPDAGAESDSDSDSSSSASADGTTAGGSGSSSSSSSPSSQGSLADLAEELFGTDCKEGENDGPILPLLPLALEDEPAEKAPEKPAPAQRLPAPAPRPSAPAPRPPAPAPRQPAPPPQQLALPAPRVAEAAGSESASPSKAKEEKEGTMRHGRWAELATLGLTCVALDDWTEVSAILPELGHDFWVGSLGCARMDEVADMLFSMKLEEHPVVGSFTHCYVARSKDQKADVGSVIDEFGLGLRKRRSQGDAAPGHVFLLACHGGTSALAQERAKLAGVDKKLSTEERVRRTHVRFEPSSLQTMVQQARRNQGSFCLTAFSGADLEACKRRAVTFDFQGEPAVLRFARCLLVEVRDCKAATEQLEREAGLGLRRSKVRSHGTPGCLALFMPESALEAARRSASSVGSPSSEGFWREVALVWNGSRFTLSRSS